MDVVSVSEFGCWIGAARRFQFFNIGITVKLFSVRW